MSNNRIFLVLLLSTTLHQCTLLKKRRFKGLTLKSHCFPHDFPRTLISPKRCFEVEALYLTVALSSAFLSYSYSYLFSCGADDPGSSQWRTSRSTW